MRLGERYLSENRTPRSVDFSPVFGDIFDCSRFFSAEQVAELALIFGFTDAIRWKGQSKMNATKHYEMILQYYVTGQVTKRICEIMRAAYNQYKKRRLFSYERQQPRNRAAAA